LRTRAIRIYPIYWVALSIWILSRFVVPDSLANADVTVKTTILSYLLVPHYHVGLNPRIWPILIPGWTLQYELFFYLIFGLSLPIALTLGRAACIIACLSVLTVAGAIFEPTNALLITYTNPLLLEFASGVILGVIYLNGGRLPQRLALVTIAVAFSGLMIDEYLFSVRQRFLLLGAPAFLVVLGAISLEQALVKRPLRPLALLGDASYSLYLFHPIAAAIVALLWARLLGTGHPEGFVCMAIGFAIAISLFVHLYVEKPITRWLSTKWECGIKKVVSPGASNG
jgi:exopolysaccharide production protein ExoZ